MKVSQKKKLIQEVGAKAVVETLEPYLTEARKGRIESVLASRLGSIQLAMEAPADINNALAAVRSSEALGLSTVHIIAPQGEAQYTRGVTQGAIYWIDVVYHNTLADFIEVMQAEQVKLVGGTVTASLSVSDVPVDEPICILLGNEQRGLTDAAVSACGVEYKIPMYGMTESFNLSVSAAISLYDTTNRKRELLKQAGDLSDTAKIKLKADYFLNSVEARLALGLLTRPGSRS